MNKNWLSCYRIEPLLLVQELSKILWRRTQHALLLKVLDSSLWFLVEPARDPHTQNTLSYHSINRMRLNWEVCVAENVQVNPLLNDLFLLFEDLELLWVVRAWHLGAVAADARRGRGVQRVNAPIAVYGLWGLGLGALLFWGFLLAWGTKKEP